MSWTKLSGTSFRQEVIDEMSGAESLYLVAEPDNEYDKNAVAVFEDETNRQVGYIRREEAPEISQLLQSGTPVQVIDYTITGGGDHHYGINIFLQKEEKDVNSPRLKRMIPDIGSGFVYFDEEEHVYYDENMKPMISGSRFESSNTPEFNPEFPAKALAKSTGVDADKIMKFWKENGRLSSGLGTLIHESNEYWIKNNHLLRKIDEAREKEHTAKNWMPEILGDIVDKYWEAVSIDNTEAELFVRYGNFCGFIDQVQWIDEKTVIMRDYKIVKEHKTVKTKNHGKQDKYTLQQNFYRTILKKNGIDVAEMYLDVYSNGKWEHKKVERVEIDEIE